MLLALGLVLAAGAAGAAGPQFTDVAASAGVAFHHRNGARGEKEPIETMGSGVVFFDYDNDGWCDLYFVNSAGPAALYRNLGNGTFAERAKSAGVANSGYGMGAVAGDYDNDGDQDLYVTAYGPDLLYRNEGGGRFADLTARAGLGDPGLSTGAAFADFDRDGDLDLYVANYVEYRPELNQVCTRAKGLRVYCGPETFQPAPDRFYRNEGEGRFTEIGAQVGLLPAGAKELGVVCIDYDDDGDPDFYVAGDRTANLLYRNEGGRFAEVGKIAGVAYNDAGKALAGMGVAAGDYDNDGGFDLFVTNYQWETNSLYRNQGAGFFADLTFGAGLGASTLSYLKWGTFFFDYDNDGDQDLFVANGHLDDNVELFDKVTYAQQNQLFQNEGGRFADVKDQSGPGMLLVQVSRGAAWADYDNDGDPDIAVANNNQPAALLRNEGGNANHWLALKLVGGGRQGCSNRDGIGAKAEVRAGGLVQVAEVRNSASYLSQSDMRLYFGLGAKTRAEGVKIRWPSGEIQRLGEVRADRLLVVEEPCGP
jgi:hypothetical protein